MTKIINKIKWQDWSALLLFMLLLLIVPITNSLVAGAVNSGFIAITELADVGFNQLSLVGMEVIQVVVTLLIVYLAWRVHGFGKINIPNKKSVTKVAGKPINTPIK
jgi:hypothetical protein